jgi:DNA-binding transcriptional LysR family regulator
VELSSTDRRVDLVREGFDCVLRIGEVTEPNLVALAVGNYQMGNYASAAYVARFGMPTRLEDLARHRLVHYVSTLGARDRGFEYIDPDHPGKARYLAMPGALTVNNSVAYTAACLAGVGIIQVPKKGVQAALAQGQLVELLPQYTAPAMPVSLVYANRRHQPRRVRMFMAWLQLLMQESLRE